ncbi:hypothetical protein [Calothrix sp. NIES-2098]|uniref:hypothetical protein n=1 Tax=Calothrix sp. NIES-2098 TaxID=1954171 RepID=UPI000B5E0F44|nr:hypothetical protein NIES2098_20670 [Calothrix sp. NIES-2098]
MADTQFENREQLEQKAENLRDQAEKIGGELTEHQENKENLMAKLERLKRRSGLYTGQQQRLEAKLQEVINTEKEAIKEGQEQLKPIQHEMKQLHKTVIEGVERMEKNRDDVQQLQQELKGDSNQVTLIKGDLNQTIINLNIEIPIAKEIGNLLGKGLEIIGDLMRGGDSSLLKSLWSTIKGIFR